MSHSDLYYGTRNCSTFQHLFQLRFPFHLHFFLITKIINVDTYIVSIFLCGDKPGNNTYLTAHGFKYLYDLIPNLLVGI